MIKINSLLKFAQIISTGNELEKKSLQLLKSKMRSPLERAH